jgi:aspartyl/asparaginyl-tRNA synthetase
MALSMDLQRVFEIGPAFRAEINSAESAKHLTEARIEPPVPAFLMDSS